MRSKHPHNHRPLYEPNNQLDTTKHNVRYCRYQDDTISSYHYQRSIPYYFLRRRSIGMMKKRKQLLWNVILIISIVILSFVPLSSSFGFHPLLPKDATIIIQRINNNNKRRTLLTTFMIPPSILPVAQNSSYSKRQYSLLTWNILAPVYAPSTKYRSCNPIYLNWSYRCNKIIDILHSSNADIICLQEVQLDQWDTLYYSSTKRSSQTTTITTITKKKRTLLGPVSVQRQQQPNHRIVAALNETYTAVIQNVSRNHPVACVILLKRTTFAIIGGTAVESRSRALLVAVQDITTTNHSTTVPPLPPIFVVNCHLEAGYDTDETRYYQIRSLLQRLQYHVRKYTTPSCKSSGSDSDADIDPYIILAGDFNTLQYKYCPIYNLLATGVLQSPSIEATLTRKNKPTDVTKTRLPFVPFYDTYRNYYYNTKSLITKPIPLTITSQSTFATINNKSRTEQPNTKTNNHFYNIRSPTSKGPFLGMTFRNGHVLDYIWVSERFVRRSDENGVLPWMILNRTVPEMKYTLPQVWPSNQVPSDHIPIGVIVTISG